MLLGAGMGGFVDGILFHQVLQMHGMLSEQYPPTSLINLEINMFWDGVFHVFTWLVTASGIALLWRTVKRADIALSGKALLGAMAVGWGLFNVIEGTANHHLLQLHHVRTGADHLRWDVAFLGAGVVLLLLGAFLIRQATGNAQAGIEQ
jgi:uncharacterized membrane protein